MAPKIDVEFAMDADTFSASLDFLAERVSSIGDRVSGLGTALAAALTAPFLLIAAPAVAAAEGHRQASNQIRLSTGAMGARLDALVGIYNSVRTGTGATIQDAATVVSEFERRLGLTGDALRDAASAAVRLAQASGAEVAPVALATAKLMQSWSVSGHEAISTMGLLRAASIGADGGVAALAQTLTAAGPQFRAAGFTLQGAAGLLARLREAGVPTEIAIAGLTRAITVLTKSGAENIAVALETHVAAIKDAETAAEAKNLAVELFGKSAVPMTEAIRSGAFALSGITRAAGNFPSAEPAFTLSRAFNILRAQIETAIVPLGQVIVPVMVRVVNALLPLVELVGAAVAAFRTLPEWLQTAVIATGAFLALAGPVLSFAGVVIKAIGSTTFVVLKVVGVYGLLAAAVASLLGSAVAASATTPATVAAAAAAVVGSSPAQAISSSGAALARTASRASNVAGDTAQAVAAAGRASALDVPSIISERAPVIPEPPMLSALPALKDLPSGIGPVQAVVAPPRIVEPKFDEPEPFQLLDDQPPTPTTLTMLVPPAPIYDPAPGERIGDAMRRHAAAIAKWFGELDAIGMLPPQPWMPGSWFDTNRPQAWLDRAAEADRLTRDTEDRTSFWEAAAEERDRLAKEEWEEQELAKRLMFGRPVIVTGDDVFDTLADVYSNDLIFQDNPPAISPGGGPVNPSTVDLNSLYDQTGEPSNPDLLQFNEGPGSGRVGGDA